MIDGAASSRDVEDIQRVNQSLEFEPQHWCMRRAVIEGLISRAV